MKNRAAHSEIRNPTVECRSVAANVLKVDDLCASTLRVA